MIEKEKHILILSSWYPNKFSPFLGNFVQRQAQILADSYKITVLHTVADPDLKDLDCSIAELENLKEIVVYHPKGSNFFSRRKEQDKAFEFGLNLIEQVDLIYAHVIVPKGYLYVRAKKKFSCPLIVTEHGSYYRAEKRNSWSLKDKFILKYTRKYIDQLIAVSDFLKRDLTSFFVDKEIQVIPNPINTNLFVPKEKKSSTTKHFLHISTLDKALKNPIGIIEAVSLLKDKGYSDFKLTLISDESTTELKALVESKELTTLINLGGPCTPEELVSYYQQSDAFVLFSAYETFSIVLAEAWACGIPTITTPVGIGFDLPHEMGIQVKINDSLSLAIGMEKILQGLTFDAEIIRKKALHYSDEKIIEELTSLYNKQFNG